MRTSNKLTTILAAWAIIASGLSSYAQTNSNIGNQLEAACKRLNTQNFQGIAEAPTWITSEPPFAESEISPNVAPPPSDRTP